MGYDLVDVEYAEGNWFAVFGDNPGLSTYAYHPNFDVFTGQIEQRLSQEFDLTDIKYADGNWFAVFGDNPGTSTYSASADLNEFTEDIEQQLAQGYDLVDVEYGDGIWLSVFNESSESATTTPSSDAITPAYDPVQNTIVPGIVQDSIYMNYNTSFDPF